MPLELNSDELLATFDLLLGTPATELNFKIPEPRLYEDLDEWEEHVVKGRKAYEKLKELHAEKLIEQGGLPEIQKPAK